MAAKKSTSRRKAKGLVGFTDDQVEAMDAEEYGARMLHDLRTTKPAITEKDVETAESRYCDGPRGIWRRAALMVLTKSGEWLLEEIAKDRKSAVAFADLAQGASEYAQTLRATAELVDAAVTRINLSLCIRRDMDAVIKEAAHG